ncbi:unnamed protein product, partial [Closterium sp. NIES-64]
EVWRGAVGELFLGVRGSERVWGGGRTVSFIERFDCPLKIGSGGRCIGGKAQVGFDCPLNIGFGRYMEAMGPEIKKKDFKKGSQRDIRDMTDQVAHNRLDYLWAAAVAENDLAFNVSKLKSIQAFVDAVIMFLRAVDTRAQVMGQLYGLMLEATVKTNAALRQLYIGEVRNDKEIRKGVDEAIQARGGDVQQRITLAAQVAQFHRGEGRLGSDDARWAATTLVEAGRMTEAEWWFLFGGEVQALQDLAVTSLSQPVTSSEVERYWSALARVQRRDRNRLTAKKMTDVTFVAFTRRARDAFDRKAALRSKLYQDLGNGTLREGAAIIPAEVEVEEGDAEEEAPVEEECTIDWSEFGSIGKKRKGKAGKSSEGKKRGKGNGACKGKGKGKAGDAEEEEEAEESGGEEEEPTLNPKGRYAWDCSDGSSGEEEEEEEDDEEYDG